MRILTPEDVLRKRIENMKGPRPCRVDGKLAIFHKWVTEDKGFLHLQHFVKRDDPGVEKALRDFHERHLIPASCSLEKLAKTCALIEWADGTVGTVSLELVKFID